MSSSAIRRACAAWLLALGAAACARAPEAPAAGMNVLLITLDTTRADFLTCLGAPVGFTPSIDRLAESGVLFERAYAGSNITAPSHLSLFTGRRLIEHRVFNNRVRLPEAVRTLPEVLRDEGYRTAAFVSVTQLGPAGGWRGFDVLEGPRGEQRRAEEVAEPLLAWLEAEADGDRPFFLWAHFFDPHTFYQPPPEIGRLFYEEDPTRGDGPRLAEHESFTTWGYEPIRRWLGDVRDPDYPAAMYAGEIHYMDRHVGRLLDEVDRLGLRERTVVVLAGDHGESLGEHELFYDHVGLYEVSLRVPLVIRVPGLEAGRRVRQPVTLLDVAPTLHELLGLEPLRGVSGLSLVPLLRGEAGAGFAGRELVFESAHNRQVALRRGRWKLIWPVPEPSPRLPDRPQLFDLRRDPAERTDLFERHPEIVAQLRPKLEPWIALRTVPTGDLPDVSEEILDSLRKLGYTGD